VKAIARELRVRARVVYCKAIGPERFAVGLNLIARDDGNFLIRKGEHQGLKKL